MLYLRTAAEVQQAADAIFDRVKWRPRPIHGLLVQSMANRAGAQELRVVVEHDPVLARSSFWEKVAWNGALKNKPWWPYRR